MSRSQFQQLLQVVKELRDPKTGCPWDLAQDHESLLKYLTEETYEFREAVEKNDYPNMKEELGDVLLQVLLHCQIASENNHFDLEAVCLELKDKLIRRHPHV